MKSGRVLPLAALASCAALTLAGCSGGSGDAAPDEPVDLTMTVWSTNEDHLALFDEIAAEYIEENPELVGSVTFESTPAADYTAALRTRIAGGQVPDLAWILEANGPEFVESGALYDLAPTLEGDADYDFDDVLDAPLDLWRSDEGLYAYPFSNSPLAVFVNTDIVAEAGQPLPSELVADDAWDWEAARGLATAVAADGEVDGMIMRDFDYQNWNRLTAIWASWGASPWSEDGTECTFDSPEMVEAMEWIHDAIFVDGALPAPGTSADFFAGESAMTVTQISRAGALDGSFDFEVVPLPSGPEGQVDVIGQAGIGVMAAGAHPEISADFLAFFTNPENAAKLGQFFPAPRESALNAEVLAASNPLLTQEQLETVVIDAVDGAQTLPAHANAGEVIEKARVVLDDLWVADADVPAVLSDVCESIQPLLGS
ncbi:ABC transporter substrate-binding protein [Microbacterium xanthum]|uniref:ABC transporter substrate-binding protein n=1 Tax=Microbacterium xanthum TaxID=3079794 RepID=UPI002AD3406B|nr:MULTISPECIES: sugar ABC transporter substrate-binding protein [unclassified Microbacterium]MDZ8170658.1 sugar ABC transporter substrate-binding protein [Microbacterium sp. KSW-48]MDZ8201184.1 sugar ABC transporter substrate-binding protein [Microbacterium sp. SSW1-59]